ncbi:MAG: hypothetical protein JNJ60_15340, partial [Rhodocyclaceae bacterium]|nr:hypothetical protein [Rhodocyclaceae bacterium]
DLLARRRAEQAAAALGASSGAFAAPDLAAIDMAREVAALPPEAADYLSVSTPSWGHTPALQPIFTAMPALLAGGRVVWGQLVQANRLMFSHAADGQLGDVVYDPAGRLGPAALQEAARKLFALRRAAGTSLPPQALAIASHLQNDLTRADGLPVPRSIAQSGLLLSSVWFERKHLPTGRLSERFFPLLIRDDAPGRVMLLPARWWPPALSAHWMEAEHAARRAEWEEARAALAGPRNEAQSLALGARLEAIEQYVARGIDEIRVADLCALGQPGFRPDCEPPPREWEWEVDADLQALAETYLTDCERARARGEALPAERARLAYACAHTAQMVAM